MHPSTDLDPRRDELTPEAARHVLGFHGHAHGYPPGNFHRLLIQTIAAADMYNRRALADAFPDYTAAYTLAAEHPDGLAILARLANGDR